MNEESKSIWKRPFKGWRLFVWRMVVLTVLTIALAILVVFCLVLTFELPLTSKVPGFVRWSLSVGIAVLAVLGVLFVRGLACWRNLKRYCLLIRGLCNWRNLRRLLIGLACLVTLLALFYAEENFRGKRAWEKHRRELEARGEQLDFKAFIPPPVPDGQNFAATPLIKSWFVWTNAASNSAFSSQDSIGQAEIRVGFSRPTDLVAWKQALEAIQAGQTNPVQRGQSLWRGGVSDQQFKSGKLDQKSRAEAAPAVLEALKTNEAVFAEVRAASERPFCRYPVDYDMEDPAAILLPHLSHVRAVCRRLNLKACAELAVNQSENALEDVRLSLHIADSLKDEPYLISYLVRIACFGFIIRPIGEGLADHAWSDVQLQELQTRLQRYDFLADSIKALDADRAAGLWMIDFFRRHPSKLDASGGEQGETENWFTKTIRPLIPQGWYYREQLNYCRLFEMLLGGTYDPVTKRVSRARINSNERALDQISSGGPTYRLVHQRTMAAMFLPAFGGVLRKAASAQTAANQAALACALERYRLANGQFPDNLDALVPAFVSQLPHDPITGEPYKYRHTDNGSFVLYSVGWNEKDDGGVPGKTDFDDKEGDWVWQYPPAP